MINEETINTLLTLATGYIGLVVGAFWLGSVIWTFKDVRSRSRDFVMRLFSVGLVALLTLPGFILYLFIRPKETLTEAYERSLEEEALLQNIEEKPTCPGCSRRVEKTWQACPSCHTRLKKACTQCGQLLELSWKVCPHCTTLQTNLNTDVLADLTYKPQTTSRKRQTSETYNTTGLEFIDENE
ncbi:MAG: zinc ribbon domain-containing protein [Anaerolineae bacterium]|nr:zinc ribbon domain-containing protein [Anaerolineae bacterium]